MDTDISLHHTLCVFAVEQMVTRFPTHSAHFWIEKCVYNKWKELNVKIALCTKPQNNKDLQVMLHKSGFTVHVNFCVSDIMRNFSHAAMQTFIVYS
jgi:hypothetical protein